MGNESFKITRLGLGGDTAVSSLDIDPISMSNWRQSKGICSVGSWNPSPQKARVRLSHIVLVSPRHQHLHVIPGIFVSSHRKS